ncbi:MAG TPA: gluconate 2-dehydrogenase subunit 3 family protein [Sphingomicrobium sp.]|nr:gluconate 2-dehydrogenase subunit 3 family protein [Sphingomicrobium sp.]HWJ58597.1 gluconate 2-dehydrogenase subunit 3 family protein [Sphingomicrobium sp.]
MSDFHSPYLTYDVLDKWHSPSWNDQTREAVRKRLEDVPPRRFLSVEQWSLLEAIADRLMPQPDRDEPVPIVPWIDDMLHHNHTPGYRYADMPPMRDAWREGLDAIAAEARHRHGKSFEELSPGDQDELLSDVQNNRVKSRSWGDLPAGGFFLHHLLKQVVAVYYSHPDAWSEIGFGGPASPRGYARLGLDERDSWEAEELHFEPADA